MANDACKIFKPILVINWRDGTMKLVKRKPAKNGPWEIPVQLEIKINIPKNPEIVAKGEIDIPGPKAKEMFIEALS